MKYKPTHIYINLDGIEKLPPEDAEREVRQYNATMEQFHSAMEQPYAVRGALMPDAHPGYAMPIGGVVATDGVIVPAWVGYDIGCGVSATKFSVNEDTFFKPDVLEEIKERIKTIVPLGFKHASYPRRWVDYEEIPKTEVVSEQFKSGDGFHQIGTLGGGKRLLPGQEGNLNILKPFLIDLEIQITRMTGANLTDAERLSEKGSMKEQATVRPLV